MVEAAVHRARPVILTALAAVLAFVPLTFDSFWGPAGLRADRRRRGGHGDHASVRAGALCAVVPAGQSRLARRADGQCLPASRAGAPPPSALAYSPGRKPAVFRSHGTKQTLSAFIWSVADLLRGDYKQSDYGKVILPFTVRRLDCVLAPTKAAAGGTGRQDRAGHQPFEPFLRRKAGVNFFNQSPLDLKKLLGDPDHAALNLTTYNPGLQPEVRVTSSERFEFQIQIERLAKAGLLYQVAEVRPDRPAPRGGQQPADGPGVRGADPQVRRDQQRPPANTSRRARSSS